LSNEPPLPPLTSQTLERLRKIADGNGLAPNAIQLILTEENIYTIEGEMRLIPKCERQGMRYQGNVRGKDRRLLPSYAALQNEADKLQKEFYESKDWLPKAIAELKSIPGQGWGQDGAQITFPKQSAKLAATEACPTCQGKQLITCSQCQGQGVVICSHCGGRGIETCYNCMGRGENPVQPGQPCPVCLGKLVTQCRFCHGTSKLACPTCQGRGGTPCQNCQGTGNITEELTLNTIVVAQFKLGSGTSLPTGLRRAMERIGVPDLAKGHADIELTVPEPEEDKSEGQATQNQGPPSEESTTLKYRVRVPYADLKLRFGTKAVMAGAFGKRGLLFGLPAFLDEALRPWRERLQQSGNARDTLEKATEVRVIRDALALELSSQGQIVSLRKLYPIGLSPECAKEILVNMALVLKRFTLHSRLLVALACFIFSAAIFSGLFLTPLHSQLTHSLPLGFEISLDFVLLISLLVLSWVGLSKSIQLILQRHFPHLKIALRQKTGRIGYGMLGGIVFAYLLIITMAPMKPTWCLRLMGSLLKMVNPHH